MSSLFVNGELASDRFATDLSEIFDYAIEYAQTRKSRNLSLLEMVWALISIDIESKRLKKLPAERAGVIRDIQRIIFNNFKAGIDKQKCLEILRFSITESRQDTINYFDPGNWSNDLKGVFAKIESYASGSLVYEGLKMPEQFQELNYAHLVFVVFQHLHEEKKEENQIFEDIFDLESIKNAVGRYISVEDVSPAAVFKPDGTVDASLFDDKAYALINESLKLAGRMGFEDLKPLHLLLAFIDDREGFGSKVLLRCLPVDESLKSLQVKLEKLLSKGPNLSSVPLEPSQANISMNVQEILQDANKRKMQAGLDTIKKKQLFLSLVELGGDVFKQTLEDNLKIDLVKVVNNAEKLEEDDRPEIMLPQDIFPCSELTKSAYDGSARRIEGRENEIKEIARIFFRKQNRNILLYGDKGVGKTAICNALSSQVVHEGISFLKNYPVIYFDLTDLPEEELKAKAERLFRYMEENHKRVYIVDDFYKLFKIYPNLCKSRLKKNRFYFLGIINSADYAELNKTGESYKDYFEFMHINEPGTEVVIAILNQYAEEFKLEYNVEFEPNLVPRLVKLAEDFLIAEKFPAKAVKVMELACSNASYEAQMDNNENAKPVITREHIAMEISSITGLPKDLILGTGEDMDYEDILSKSIIGQDFAVSKVAERLKLIQAGMVDKSKPPAIFMFIGLTGTGKTELANEIAKVYSNSRRLITYSMENFKDKHNVSGIVGTSAGYVGFEEGGRLINDLNNDPYSVFLFDEVEKAHPDIWDPMLNLFDKGSIVDLKGNVAYGNKAFFILTSNIGYEEICSMLRNNRSMEEIQEVVLDLLYSAVHRDTREKCFRPELLGRIIGRGGIVVFNPLSHDAMRNITRKVVAQICDEWRATREGELIVEQEVIDYIAAKSFDDNEKSLNNILSGAGIGSQGVTYKGARIIFSLVDQMITNLLAENIRKLHSAKEVRVVLKSNRPEVIYDSDEVSLNDYGKLRKEALGEEILQSITELNTYASNVSAKSLREVEKVKEHVDEILNIIKD